jgi:hypothetical protein
MKLSITIAEDYCYLWTYQRKVTDDNIFWRLMHPEGLP